MQHGIKKEFSCPSTSEQNGVSERKHRHITETGLTRQERSERKAGPFYAFSFRGSGQFHTAVIVCYQ